MTKYSPAPWTWTDDCSQLDSSDGWQILSDYGYGVAADIAGHRNLLCGDYDTKLVNGRLIAAAPDLFELVQDMLANFHDQECNDEVIEIVARAKFTIAKVLGESA